jgi:anti-anti-sigma regulatory factor
VNIEKREDPKGTVTLQLSGRIDTNTSPQLRAAIINASGIRSGFTLNYRIKHQLMA